MSQSISFLSEKLFREEADRCESCKNKPCQGACPAGCSPAEFIQAAKGMRPSDFQRAAAMILSQNPIGGICGSICSEKHCMSACSRGKAGRPVSIPALQSYIIYRAQLDGIRQAFPACQKDGEKVAVLGAGPAGLSAAAVLACAGKEVHLYDDNPTSGGMCRLIPEDRLPREMLDKNISFLTDLGIFFHQSTSPLLAEALLTQYEKVIDASGRHQKVTLDIPGKEYAIDALDFLAEPRIHDRVAIIGCGGIAVDCAAAALQQGASGAELFALEQLCELNLGSKERETLFAPGVSVHTRTAVSAIRQEANGQFSLLTEDVLLPPGASFHPSAVQHMAESQRWAGPVDTVIFAIGSRALPSSDHPHLIRAGECAIGAATAVEAAASGKAAAYQLLGLDQGGETKPLPSYQPLPVSLQTTVFGRTVRSPFFVSASPPSDGYAQLKAAYDAGWAGGILKTGFDGVPIHTPGEYMHSTDRFSYANCDGVSARPLDALCEDIRRLREEYPDRMTMASTGADLTGDDAIDRKNWLTCTHKLEKAGAMGIEYSLSCPGSDGPDSLAVNQDADKTEKIVRWILEGSNPDVPKLFKLTASAPNVGVIAERLSSLAAEFPMAKFGITIGDTIPILVFQNRGKSQWEDGVVMGVGGKGIAPINQYAVSKVVGCKLPVSASGGVMSYRDAADFLAMGVEFVQCCSIIMRYGYESIRELESGLSWLMWSRSLHSVEELRHACGERIILPYEELSAEKKIPQVDIGLCTSCGNCLRCPAQAVQLDPEGHPTFDPNRCVGCTFCNQICFTGALSMRNR